VFFEEFGLQRAEYPLLYQIFFYNFPKKFLNTDYVSKKDRDNLWIISLFKSDLAVSNLSLTGADVKVSGLTFQSTFSSS
jgi:hypothetical protein